MTLLIVKAKCISFFLHLKIRSKLERSQQKLTLILKGPQLTNSNKLGARHFVTPKTCHINFPPANLGQDKEGSASEKKERLN